MVNAIVETDTRRDYCSCEIGHRDQVDAFPVGATVETTVAIADKVADKLMPVGTEGEVKGHCDDGRAYIEFKEHGTHTFHFPDSYIRLAVKPQMFASAATVRAALFDILDHGDQDGQRWAFYENPHERFAKGTFAWTEDNANAERSNFVDAVIARIAELQNPPHAGVKLENLCDFHKRRVLPPPSNEVCRMCQVERRGRR